jgi:hypothetical protein
MNQRRLFPPEPKENSPAWRNGVGPNQMGTGLPTKVATRRIRGWLLLLYGAIGLAGGWTWAKPIALHPENPHYFLFRGKPTVLISSTEHYGGVLNLDFNYVRYFNELQAHELNLTRVFSGAYMETPTSFNIAGNTLAPGTNRLVCPWARSSQPGYANGGNKFDLRTWDKAYFSRLKDFVTQAGKRGVVVEFVLFCPFYDNSQWRISPLNATNNIQGIGRIDRERVYTLSNEGLLEVQDNLVRKIASELKGYDNVYYEICNEPYFGGVTLEWQAHIAATLASAEASLRDKHLIAQNITNGFARIQHPIPEVSLFNFHYASPPNAVSMNSFLNKPIGDDETGFKGVEDGVYRREAWEFIMAGGAVFDHLDYSFTVGHEDGSFAYPAKQPGGGSRALRRQLQALKKFLSGFNMVQLRPDNGLFRGGLPTGAVARALVEKGKACAIYIHGGAQAGPKLELPGGTYRVSWLDPISGAWTKTETLKHGSGVLTLTSPAYDGEIALQVVRQGP